MSKVTIYSSDTCAYCMMAKRLLNSKGITPTEINVDHDPDIRKDLINRTGQRTVPQIFIGDRHIGGYSDLMTLNRQGRLDSAL
jgi:glutaredoxin 3